MAKIVLIGASGFIGSAILNEALLRGHEVKAIVRDPSKIKVQNDHLEIIKGDVMDADVVERAAKGQDAVISAYNPGWTNPNLYQDTLSAYTAILNGVKAAGIHRLLIVGGAGTLYVKPGVTVIDTGVLPEAILPGVKGTAEVYNNYLQKETTLDWVFFSPAGHIAPGERTNKFRLGLDDLIVDESGNSNISVEDYAVAMIDELEQPSHHQQRFTIGY